MIPFSLVVVSLMISTSTAVPVTASQPVAKYIDVAEKLYETTRERNGIFYRILMLIYHIFTAIFSTIVSILRCCVHVILFILEKLLSITGIALSLLVFIINIISMVVYGIGEFFINTDRIIFLIMGKILVFLSIILDACSGFLSVVVDIISAITKIADKIW
ncbi:MAG: hypothetical protein J7K38_05780 [Thermoplasmata archaeon]|nr:hypothetical protein [Thermoplasmata archaeon]